jgi:predicted MFS family arabinose efflux permease
VVIVSALVRLELRHPAPLVDPRLFAVPTFTAAVGAAVAGFAAFSGCLFALTLALQDDHGLTPLAAGLLVLPLGLAALVTSPLCGRLVARGRGWSALRGSGLVLAAALLLLMVAVRPAALDVPLVVAAAACFGVGFGLLNPPVTATAVAGLPPERTGVAAALASTSRQLGQTLGVAVTGGLVVHGAGAVWPALACCALLVAVLGVVGQRAANGIQNQGVRREVAR